MKTQRENIEMSLTPFGEDKENFLERLVRHQAGGIDGVAEGGDEMLTRFISDLDKIFQAEGGSTTYPYLTDALIAFAMEKYYRETTASPGYQQELFTLRSGGVQFDTTDVAPDITQAKGYTGPTFSDYLCKYLTAPHFSLKEEALVKEARYDNCFERKAA